MQAVSLTEVVAEQERRSFGRWLRSTTPEYDWDVGHLALLASVLGRAATSPSNIVVELPVRHGKSELGTVRYPVWRMERDPSTRVVVACYNAETAERFGRKARRVADARVLALASDRQAAREWETPHGGTFRSVGIGGGVTGYGFDLLMVDDPIKGREDADSATMREKTWDWFTDDLWTRREPGASVVVVMSRWHEDDLVGRIFERMGSEFERVTVPALAVDDDPLGRAPGEALWPARFNEAALAAIRADIGERAFSALYQQSPVPVGRGFFSETAVQYCDDVPEGAKVRRWDIAGTAGAGDWTVGALVVRDGDGRYCIADVVRGQWGSHDRDTAIRATADRDGPAVRVVLPQDPGAAGKSLAEHFVRLLAGYAVSTVRETGSKETRAEPWASQWNGGNVRLARAPWNRAVVEEHCSFPFGRHDDCVDACAGAFLELAGRGEGSFFAV